jgi:hypothetical protein
MVHALLCRDRLIVPFARVDETAKFWTAMVDVSWGMSMTILTVTVAIYLQLLPFLT